MNMKIKTAAIILLSLFLLVSLISCTSSKDETPVPQTDKVLNGVDLKDYTIVYSEEAPDYNLRAAQYIQKTIEERTGVRLEVVEDSASSSPYEIVVGETERAISASLNADTEHMQFAFLAENGRIAMEGDYFIIAAAAYYFVETYIPREAFSSAVAEEVTVCEPIAEKANNYIFLIGDGMGEYQTKLFEIMDVPTEGDNAFSDGEDIFYGYYFPYMGWSKTESRSGLTDSAAGGTALACGWKTMNNKVGLTLYDQRIDSLTEIAFLNHNKATAVMSTEPQNAATPAAFSAHTPSRSNFNEILAQQQTMASQYGTIFRGNFDFYTVEGVATLENAITETLTALSENENGFFMMYEEAWIDKHCHSNDLDPTLLTIMRFNQAIGLFMEYAFYNPDTFVLITADHETGGLRPNDEGGFSYHSNDHTLDNVPVFVYGNGAEIFDGVTMENVVIPKTIAMTFWGEETFGDTRYEPLS